MPASPPIRVLFLVDRMGYPDGSTHGGTTYFLSTLPLLARSDIELTVCFLAPRHPAAEKLEAQGVEPIFLNRGKWDPRAFFDVYRIVRERRIDVLHLASLKSMLFGRWIARMTGARAVIHLHDTAPLPAVMGPLERITARWTDATIILSESMRPWAAREFAIRAEDAIVIPNGIDTSRFHCAGDDARDRLRRELNVVDDAPLIMVAGRIIPEKGQDRLIRAMPAILRRLPRAHLFIVGEGQTRNHCKRLVEEMNLNSHVTFTGYRTDVPDLLAAADVVAVPSLSEAFGYSALEAMAAGRPVVAFRTGGLVDVIEDGVSGLLVKPDDETALARAIVRVLEDQPLAQRISQAGRERAETFSLESHVRRLLEVYESVCVEPRRRDASCPSATQPAHAMRLAGRTQTD